MKYFFRMVFENKYFCKPDLMIDITRISNLSEPNLTSIRSELNVKEFKAEKD
jgi:hypothetical protein